MKIQCLKVIANLAAIAVKQANSTASRYWSYQPKAPENVKSFKK